LLKETTGAFNGFQSKHTIEGLTLSYMKQSTNLVCIAQSKQ